MFGHQGGNGFVAPHHAGALKKKGQADGDGQKNNGQEDWNDFFIFRLPGDAGGPELQGKFKP